MSIFGANISLLNKFLKHFSSCFSKKQMAMFPLVIYALFKDYKRNSLDAMAKATHTDYQKFQYFFSDSKWDIQAIKRTRLEIIQKQRTTASTKDGLLAIDDTGCPKPFAKRPRGQSGNIVDHSKERRSAMSALAPSSSHQQSTSLST